jgi:hypothetical protein
LLIVPLCSTSVIRPFHSKPCRSILSAIAIFRQP